MSNLTNYHSHCSFCDGKAPLEDFVLQAVAECFSAYGVSSHAPLPFETRWTLRKADVPEYLAEVSRIREKYRDRIEIYAGMEIDYLDAVHNPSTSFFRELPLDYRIGSVHLLHDGDGSLVDIDTGRELFVSNIGDHFHGDIRSVLNLYYDKLSLMIEAGGFDILGHADKMSYNAEGYCPGITTQDWYRKRIRDYFGLIAEKGVMVEVNTKMYLKAGLFFPDRSHFGLMHDLGIPVVVNSDAHLPELIHAGRPEALALLYQAGYRTVRELHRNAWQEVELCGS